MCRACYTDPAITLRVLQEYSDFLNLPEEEQERIYTQIYCHPLMGPEKFLYPFKHLQKTNESNLCALRLITAYRLGCYGFQVAILATELFYKIKQFFLQHNWDISHIEECERDLYRIAAKIDKDSLLVQRCYSTYCGIKFDYLKFQQEIDKDAMQKLSSEFKDESKEQTGTLFTRLLALFNL